MSPNDLQALFSNLRPRSQEESIGSPAVPSINQPNPQVEASSTYLDTALAPATPPPPFSVASDELTAHNSETLVPTRSANGATAQNLLTLLNFGAPHNVSSPSIPPKPSRNDPTAPVPSNNASISASDLVARFMSPASVAIRGSLSEEANEMMKQSQPSASRATLLDLLSKQAIAASNPDRPDEGVVDGGDENVDQVEADQLVTSIENPADTLVPRPPEDSSESPVRVFGSAASREPTPFEAPQLTEPQQNEQGPIFTYTNPFEALNASRNHATTRASDVQPTVENAQNPAGLGLQTSPVKNPPVDISARKKLTPKLRSQRLATSANQEPSPVVPTDKISEPTTIAADATRTGPQYSKSSDVPAPTLEEEFQQADLPAPGIVEESKATRTEQPHDHQDESGEWEDADDSTGKDVSPREVLVYNFPVKAFVSITLLLDDDTGVGIREDGIMEISRLKKDFDQLDRSLAAATAKYITYAFVKNGGMRIIRQDDGSDHHVFKNSHDRIFNVAFCTTAINGPPSDDQAVLGTGISGAVYYANISKEGNDLFQKNQLDAESLIFPPYPQGDENTAGGVLKTRAKRSSRHPEYFAIGRGKSIQIVWPATAISPRYGITDTNRTVDVEKLYADRPLQIMTGKAGKDFTFSEDDTLIVSLDKTGRLRFWDIRSLVDESNATAAKVNPVIVDTPILSLSTASPAEKSWPTSVTFVDKARPYKKGGALRYVLVGLRQNHTLQLWDIALGKAVQELNFPHDNETDGICSVNYHPESGIIVLSHPTRNSLFFIHLSSPRYALSSSLSQASYVQRVAAKDPEISRPESTACMSGIREISFAEKGQLRSVEILPIQKSSDTPKDDLASLFELYVVHSKGVLCLGINRQDLGWNSENKVINPIDALQLGFITMTELKLGSVIEEPVRNASPPKEAQQSTKPSKKKAKKNVLPAGESSNGTEKVQQPLQRTLPATQAPEHVKPDLPPSEIQVSKEAKKLKKKNEKPEPTPDTTAEKPETDRVSSPIQSISQQTSTKVESRPDNVARNGLQVAPSSPPITESSLSEGLKSVEQGIFSGLKSQFENLYHTIASDRKAQDAASASRQEEILRRVSSSLATNVERALSGILAQQIQQQVVPAMVQHVSTQVTETLATSLSEMLPQEINAQLPIIVSASLQSPQMIRSIAESVAQRMSRPLEIQITDMVTKSITPVFRNIAVAAAEQASSHTESRLSTQLQQLQFDRAEDSEKINQLTSLVQSMTTVVQNMADAQNTFQGQVLKDRSLSYPASNTVVSQSTRQVSTARGTPDLAPLPKPKPKRIRSKAEIELEEITALMNDGRYEEGSIKWLQSTQPVKLFDDLFVRFTPEYLTTDVSPLVAFSIAVTVANSLATNTERRLEWISAAFDVVDLQDPEIADLSQHAPALINSLIQRLESLYMTTAEKDPSDPMLKTIPLLAKQGRDMKSAFTMKATGTTNFASTTY